MQSDPMAPRNRRASDLCLRARGAAGKLAVRPTETEPEDVTRMNRFFPKIKKIAYEGPKSRNPLAFHHYNPAEKILGKPMRDHLRFAACFWHTMRTLRPWPIAPSNFDG